MKERVSAPASLPVSLAEAKEQLRVDTSADDDFIQRLVEAATEQLDGDGELGRAMINQSWAEWSGPSPEAVKLTMGPFQSLTSVEYYDTDGALQTATLSNFETRKDGDFVTCRPKTGFAWPATQDRDDAIKITYVAGFGATSADVPQPLRHAVLMLVTHFEQNRSAIADRAMFEMPMAVERLVGRYRVDWYG